MKRKLSIHFIVSYVTLTLQESLASVAGAVSVVWALFPTIIIPSEQVDVFEGDDVRLLDRKKSTTNVF
jgi:hypothetical protein